MDEHLKRRLAELRIEYETGQKEASQLQTKLDELNRTLLRISGAIQVLEEMLASENLSPR